MAPDRPLVRGALLGLTCPDVMAMELVDLPVIVAALNRRVKEAGVVRVPIALRDSGSGASTPDFARA